MARVIGVMLLRLLVYLSVLTFSNGDEYRLNYGIIFPQQKDVDFATDMWTNTFEIELYLNPNVNLPKQMCAQRKNPSCILMNQMLTQVTYMKSNVKHHIIQTLDLLTKIIPTLPTNSSRFRKAILPFVAARSFNSK